MATEPVRQAQETAPRGGWRTVLAAFLGNEIVRYALSAGVVMAAMLLVPQLLNNMILTLVILLLGVSIIPEMLRKRR